MWHIVRSVDHSLHLAKTPLILLTARVHGALDELHAAWHDNVKFDWVVHIEN